VGGRGPPPPKKNVEKFGAQPERVGPFFLILKNGLKKLGLRRQ